MCISTAQARTKSAARVLLHLAARHFSCKFSHKMALLRCPCPFRLRRLAQSVGPGLVMLLGRGSFPENSRVKSFVTCPCPFQACRKYGSRQAAWALRARFSRLFRLEPTKDARAGEDDAVPRDDRWKLLWNPVVNEYPRRKESQCRTNFLLSLQAGNAWEHRGSKFLSP